MLRFGERITLFFFRPLYRTFVERLLWWFLTKVKIFFMADLVAQVDSIDRRLREDHHERWAAIDQRLQNLEASNAAHWQAIEELLLALFRSSELPGLDSEWKGATAEQVAAVVPIAAELNRVDGPNRIR
jgi:hypothetical protein